MRIDVALAQLRGRVRACVTAQAHFLRVSTIREREGKYPYLIELRRLGMRVDRARVFDDRDRANRKAAANSRLCMRRNTYGFVLCWSFRLPNFRADHRSAKR